MDRDGWVMTSDPYILLADPEALGLLEMRRRFGLLSPDEAETLAAVQRERERRRRFAQAGEIIRADGLADGPPQTR